MKLIFELAIEDVNVTAELEKQRAAVKELTKEFRAFKGTADDTQALAQRLGEAKANVASLTAQQRELNREFRAVNVATDSLKGMQIEYARLVDQVSKLTKAQRESADGRALIKQTNALKQEINGIEQSFGRFTGSVGNYQKALISTFDIVTAGLITGGIQRGVEIVIQTLTKGVEAFTAYEAALDNLSALTGVTGTALEQFAASAEQLTNIQLGDSEIVNSAASIVEAFKLVGGAQPELLKSAEALEEVTKQTIILSKASGDTLTASVDAVITTLGQYSLGASEAERVTNELAAGAKAGASEIPDTTKALKEFGTTAAVVNVTTAESVALIQTLAEQQLKGAEAGTQLRNILARIASADVLPRNALTALRDAGVSIETLKDNTLPLETRLAELSKLAGDTSKLVKVFGLENLTAAQILTQNVGRYKEFTTAITGTNEAYRQAETNAGNLRTQFSNLQQEGINTLVEGVEALAPALSVVVSLFARLLGILGAIFSGFKELPKFIAENRDAFAGLATGLILLNGQLILASLNSLRLAAVEKGRILITAATTAAQYALNAAMRANPIGLIITTVSALAIGFKSLYDRSEQVRASISGLSNVARETFTIVKESVTAFIQGFKDLASGNFDSALSNFGESIKKGNPIGIALTQGKRLKDAFNEGFADKTEEQRRARAEEERDDRQVRTAEKKATAIKNITENTARDAKEKAKAAAKLLDDQIRRINEARKAIRDLDAETITNEFDRQEIELQNERFAALEKVETQRLALEKKIQGQRGLRTKEDEQEAALISEESASIIAVYEQRFAKISDARKAAFDEQENELRALGLEVEQLAKQNAEAIAQIEVDTLNAGFAQQKQTLEQQRTERLKILRDQFANGDISEKEFRARSVQESEDYNTKILSIERQRAEQIRALTDTLSSAKIEGARAGLAAELNAIQSALDADVAALRERAKVQGVDTAEQIAEREKKAIQERAAANAAFANAERQAIEENKNSELAALDAVNEADKQVQDDKLKRLDEEKAKRQELQDAALSVTGSIAGAVLQIEKNRIAAQQQEASAALDKEFAARREKAKGNQAEIEKIDKEYERRKVALEKAAASERKKIAIKEAIIQGALSVVKALPNLILAGVAAIATAAQIAVINSQTFARGGIAKLKQGVFGGKHHAQGGTKGYFDDGTQIEVEKDELFVILNRRASKAIAALGDHNFRFGGRKFESGGAFDFSPQIAIPGQGRQNSGAIIVQTQATFSEEQIDQLATALADRTAAATQSAIGNGLNDANRRLERENALTQNREV